MMKKLKLFKNYIIFSACFFALSCLVGYFFAESSPELADQAIARIIQELQGLLHPNPLIQFMIIFYHNTLASFIVIASFFLFGATALFSLFTNGLILGVVLSAHLKGNGLLSAFSLLVPHGIIELPAFFLSSAIGIWLGFRFALSFLPKYGFRDAFVFAFKLFFTLIIPLLFAAALIESFVTPFVFELAR